MTTTTNADKAKMILRWIERAEKQDKDAREGVADALLKAGIEAIAWNGEELAFFSALGNIARLLKRRIDTRLEEIKAVECGTGTPLHDARQEAIVCIAEAFLADLKKKLLLRGATQYSDGFKQVIDFHRHAAEQRTFRELAINVLELER